MIICGYTITEQLSESTRSLVFRGVRQDNGQSAVLKLPARPDIDRISCIKHEYVIGSRFRHNKIIAMLGLDEHDSLPVLIEEDFDGLPLTVTHRGRITDILHFLDIALQVADGLREIHRQGMIYKNLCPTHILYRVCTGRIKLIDFSIAGTREKEYPFYATPQLPQGSLAYSSPEQTGRINKELDYRSDFYSLGVILFELLTGNRPFTGTELFEKTNSTSPVTPLTEDYPDIPATVSEIIVRLLAPAAENRYQNSNDLITDLLTSLIELQEKRSITVFSVSRQDRHPVFSIPDKRYGSNADLQTLLRGYEAIGSRHAAAFLITGVSGSGKSLLLREAKRTMAARGGIILGGPSIADGDNGPLTPIIAAFADLTRLILQADQREQTYWRDLLNSALGGRADIACDLLPDLAQIIGSRKTVGDRDPAAVKNVIISLFLDVAKAINRQFTTLVVMIDDLDRVDPETLRFIEGYIKDSEQTGMFIGSTCEARQATEPLFRSIAESGVDLISLPLNPMRSDDIGMLISETLFQPRTATASLAQICGERSGGNPFYLKHYLHHLYHAGAIVFNADSGRWDCDPEAIATVPPRLDIEELLCDRIVSLPSPVRIALQRAACIGTRFDLSLLSALCGNSRRHIRLEIQRMVDEDLVAPVSDPSSEGLKTTPEPRNAPEIFTFTHELVRRVIFSFLPEDERNAIHERIGSHMLHWSAANRSRYLFDLVGHLNHAGRALSSADHRRELAALNFAAARTARRRGLLPHYHRFAATGLTLLPKSSWQDDYRLTLDLHSEAAEAAACNNRPDDFSRLYTTVCHHARSDTDKARVYLAVIRFHQSGGRLEQALAAAMQILAELGIDLPETTGKATINGARAGIGKLLHGRTKRQLLDLPKMHSPYYRMIMDLLFACTEIAYQARPSLLPPIAHTVIRLSLTHGNHPTTGSVGYPLFGSLLCLDGAVVEGYRYALFGLRLQKCFADHPHPFSVSLVHEHVVHLHRHLQTSLSALRKSYRVGLEMGQQEHAERCAFGLTTRLFFLGRPLSEVKETIRLQQQQTTGNRHDRFAYRQMILHQAIAHLQGNYANPQILSGRHYDKDTFLAVHHRQKDSGTVLFHHLMSLVIAYHYGSYEVAEQHGRLALAMVDPLLSSFLVPVLQCYHALAVLALAPTKHFGQKRARRRSVRVALNKLHSWSKTAPDNYRAKYLLLSAEFYRQNGLVESAAQYYEHAVRQAEEAGNILDEALCYERAARFYQALDRQLVAHSYLSEAFHRYRRWQAGALVSHLRSTQAPLLAPRLHRPHRQQVPAAVPRLPGTRFDIADFVEASRTFGSALYPGDVAVKLIQTLVRQSDAETGYLLINTPDTLMVKARATRNEDRGCPMDVPLQVVSRQLCVAIVTYVVHFDTAVVLDNAVEHGLFSSDPYVVRNRPKSICCIPITYQDRLLAVMYLEDCLRAAAFSGEQQEILELLAGQAAISIHNAQLYETLQGTLHQLHQEISIRKETQMQLLHAGKLSALGRLSASIAHEFGNPLIGIKYLLDDLAEKRELSEEDRHLIGVGLQECERLKKLISDLQDLHQPSSGARTPVSLNSVVHNVLSLQRKHFKVAGVIIHTSLAHNLPKILAVEDQITQVVVNLTDNAVEAMKKQGGTLRVTTRADDDRVILELADTGVGISAEHQEHLFEPFFSTKGHAEGTGLGLAIVYSIVKNNRGEITYRSTPGKGTLFTVSFRMTDDRFPSDRSRPGQ